MVTAINQNLVTINMYQIWIQLIHYISFFMQSLDHNETRIASQYGLNVFKKWKN